MVNPDHYTYRVSFSPEDHEHVATVAELPSLSWLAGSPQDALSGLTALVHEVVADMEQSGESVPEPLADREYSGRFQVRVLPELHRALVIRAHEQNVSLNRLVSDRLASA
ncbi:type II toxin-antitoxin system HicB family antitoxin [Demequina sp. NBRC 110054]|uniref:type II toxin-antitoxin system HicB family antitoxin n=1 Tax=Demequina sp. NBRC 110054 TaxID=1570343 RepID=UPI000A021E08|nr:toxin-antitoxin system HicB family antitoxin [Demequina sp. NBRC 110054]